MSVSFSAIEHIVWHGPLMGKVRNHLETLQQDRLVEMLDTLEMKAVVRFSSEISKGPVNPALSDDARSLSREFGRPCTPSCDTGTHHNLLAITPAGLNQLVDTVGLVLHETGAEKSLCRAYDQFAGELKSIAAPAINCRATQVCGYDHIL